jgi:hypothetical protein
VKVDGKLNFNEWAEGLKLGRTYTSEGKSHIMDFTINDVELGTKNSEVRLTHPSKIIVRSKVAAYLNEVPDSIIKKTDPVNNIWGQRPWWNLERARVGKTRMVPVELIVNGNVVLTKNIVADGSIQDISFETTISQSSWVALRIMPSSHTNPIFVLVDNKPIRASRKSAEWCLQAVDQCWNQKSSQISVAEKAEAKAAYDQAKEEYKKIIVASKEQ